MYQSAHTNHTVMEKNLLFLIAEPSGPKLFVIRVLQPSSSTGAILGYKTSNSPIIHTNQDTTTIAILLHGDWDISLISLKSHTEVQRGGLWRSSNDVIGTNSPVTIRSNFPQGTSPGSLDIFDSLGGMLDFSKIRALLCHGASISETPGRNSIFENAGRENCFEVEKDGRKNSKIWLQLNHANSNHVDLITANSTNIEPKNQHDSAKYCSLHKMMLWDLHDPQSSKNSATAQASTFSTIIHMAHNDALLVHTHSSVPVLRKFAYRTSDLTSPSNGNHFQQAPYLHTILHHAITHPNRYHMYQLTLIQTQSC